MRIAASSTTINFDGNLSPPAPIRKRQPSDETVATSRFTNLIQ
jgi:hypothetical protein